MLLVLTVRKVLGMSGLPDRPRKEASVGFQPSNQEKRRAEAERSHLAVRITRSLIEEVRPDSPEPTTPLAACKHVLGKFSPTHDNLGLLNKDTAASNIRTKDW